MRTSIPGVNIHFDSKWVVEGDTVYYSDSFELLSVTCSTHSSSFAHLMVRRKSGPTTTCHTFCIMISVEDVTWIALPEDALKKKVAEITAKQ